ncbi:membrane protein DedA with SNARE-associated domain [Aureimonas jatrophae]|uniref:Membrane protein DedA, SNARE-associated domain n=2 Tax=Aureimonas jatrophae TaxID=1166073 RepID=A0A1H0K1N9_9HYPH|nr:DedA family protein [Aureimonas jatrophae]MBB3950898.1 membrane protein DedA with SNARE-associated domain [Aureimonas jatrophae]SDO49662.1 membrane protein DedA, SNARE-associated domain [Aureimonas jatrophae]
MNGILAAISRVVVWVISAGGLPALALLMALESACIPIPSEIVLPFAGYLVGEGRFTLLGVATAGAIGCNLGSAVAYLAGSRGGRASVERFSRHSVFGRAELAMADRFFARFGSAAVFAGRLLPVVRTFVALPAGIARMNVWTFHAFTFAGSWIWCYVLARIGLSLGHGWASDPRLKTAFHAADILVVVALAAGLGWFLVSRRRRSRPR